MKKKCFRNNSIALRDQIPENLRKEKSERIFLRLKELDVYQRAKSVFIFVSMGSEVQTINWFPELMREKEIYIPSTRKGDSEMKMVSVHHLEELEVNYWGLLELPQNLVAERERQTADLIVTPGLAFDPKGYRMGYGGGFYDRFFATHDGFRLGVGFSEQLVKEVPHDHFDETLHAFLSEKDYLSFL